MKVSDRLTAQVRGEIETNDDGVLFIRRVHVRYDLKTLPETKEKVDRVFDIHHHHCPVYQSLCQGIEISTELNWKASS